MLLCFFIAGYEGGTLLSFVAREKLRFFSESVCLACPQVLADFLGDQGFKYCKVIGEAYRDNDNEDNRKLWKYNLTTLHSSNDWFSNNYKRWQCVFYIKESAHSPPQVIR